MDKAILYLIPVTLGNGSPEKVLPPYNIKIVSELRHFIVENIRSARRFLKLCNPEIDIDSCRFFELNKHTNPIEIEGFLSPMAKGLDMGVISEAGCPAVADPGADVVSLAQKAGFKVVPLVGPSSLLMAIMGAGFNGQCFTFNGYLPIDNAERIKKIKRMEGRAYDEDCTQLFIETPYRNLKLAEELIKTCKPTTRLCIAMNISCDNEYIVTKNISEWKNRLPEMHKQPCVFLIYKN